MADLDPIDPLLIPAPPRERFITWQVAASLAIHAGILLFLVWPSVRTSLEALPPAAIEVELVTPSDEPSASSPPPSTESEAPSSEASASQEPPSASAAASESEPPSSQEASESAASEASSAETPSSAVEPPPSGQPDAAAESSAPVAPVPMLRPVVVPIGSTDTPSTDPSSVEGSGVAELTVESGDIAAGDDTAAPGEADNPVASQMGKLHVADNFYLATILSSDAMAKASDALKSLPPDKRLRQTCNIEAVGQVANAGRGYTPDAVIAEAFSKAVVAGPRLTASGAIFRSGQKWYALAFDCTLNADLTSVTKFTYRLGPDVTTLVTKPQ